MFGTPPIRPLSFDEILDDIVEEARSASDQSRRATFAAEPGIRWFSRLLDMDTKPEAPDALGAKRDGYSDEVREISAPRDDEETVAAELGLARITSLAELKEIRRAFALRNHPDLLHPTVQGWATRRMTIANMLIDRRGKELARAR